MCAGLVRTRGTRGVGALLAAVIMVTLFGGAGLPPGRWPVDGPVVRDYDPPARDWQPGHRGLDIGADPGTTVYAAAEGRISFVGKIAGREVLVVDHGRVRTTYEPVRATVRVGDRVRLGQPIGELQIGHPCGGVNSCLHWGLKRGEQYLDPRGLLGSAPAEGDVRMLPGDSRPAAREAAKKRAEAAARAAGAGSPGSPIPLRPVAPFSGRATTPLPQGQFRIGARWRELGSWSRWHTGQDFPAPIGTVMVAAADGVIVDVPAATGWAGAQVFAIRVSDGSHVLYAHGTRLLPSGTQVKAGQPVGRVGMLGRTFGPHLHFEYYPKGVAPGQVYSTGDPLTWLRANGAPV